MSVFIPTKPTHTSACCDMTKEDFVKVEDIDSALIDDIDWGNPCRLNVFLRNCVQIHFPKARDYIFKETQNNLLMEAMSRPLGPYLFSTITEVYPDSFLYVNPSDGKGVLHCLFDDLLHFSLKIFVFLMGHLPKDQLNVVDHRGRTPLDCAIEQLEKFYRFEKEGKKYDQYKMFVDYFGVEAIPQYAMAYSACIETLKQRGALTGREVRDIARKRHAVSSSSSSSGLKSLTTSEKEQKIAV